MPKSKLIVLRATYAKGASAEILRSHWKGNGGKLDAVKAALIKKWIEANHIHKEQITVSIPFFTYGAEFANYHGKLVGELSK